MNFQFKPSVLSGAKAHIYFATLAARLKSCPDASGLFIELFRGLSVVPHEQQNKPRALVSAEN